MARREKNTVGPRARAALGPVLVAVGAPAAAAGVALGVGWAGASGWLGDGWVAFFGLFLPLCGLALHAFAQSGGRAGPAAALAVLAGVPAVVGVFIALMGVDDLVLRDRGVEVTCVVREVTSRVETDSTFAPEGQHLTHTVKYDHRLDCPPGAPARLTREREIAKAGGELRLVYDPRGEVEPQKPEDLHAWGLRFATLFAVGLAALLGAFGAIGGASGGRDELNG
ncbi:hypothetical protein [Streptomyces sp. NBC_00503]|uniref:hypothetical protein n=1 Tax=Streptomyces sp. NBC_00503 TaxID=2903659 RepID=UPI002E80DDC0|nr:hypothetical protein [Streptomyces sp. NBC_00503]WUD82085.1 hypothetical protein OG490_16895 [Streptomyces sp. NBC_00503]